MAEEIHQGISGLYHHQEEDGEREAGEVYANCLNTGALPLQYMCIWLAVWITWRAHRYSQQ